MECGRGHRCWNKRGGRRIRRSSRGDSGRGESETAEVGWELASKIPGRPGKCVKHQGQCQRRSGQLQMTASRHKILHKAEAPSCSTCTRPMVFATTSYSSACVVVEQCHIGSRGRKVVILFVQGEVGRPGPSCGAPSRGAAVPRGESTSKPNSSCQNPKHSAPFTECCSPAKVSDGVVGFLAPWNIDEIRSVRTSAYIISTTYTYNFRNSLFPHGLGAGQHQLPGIPQQTVIRTCYGM